MSKSILITGSTDSIDKLAAIELASVGHTIYLYLVFSYTQTDYTTKLRTGQKTNHGEVEKAECIAYYKTPFLLCLHGSKSSMD